MKRLRIADIAAKAGVSTTTVSFVLSGKAATYRISRPLEERVRRIAEEMGYTPNLVARSLRSQTTETIGVVALGKQDPYSYQFLEAIEEMAEADGLSVFIGYSSRDPATLEGRIRQLLDWRVAGIIFEWVPGFEQTETFRAIDAGKLCPTVAIRVHVPKGNVVNVGYDHRTILDQALDRGLALGHRRYVIVDSSFHIEDQRDREEHFHHRLAQLGDGYGGEVVQGPQDEAVVSEAVLPLLQRAAPARPTFAVAYSQARADGCLAAAEQAGVGVPDAFSIVCITGYRQKRNQRVMFDQFWYDHHAQGIHAFETLMQLRAGAYDGPLHAYRALGEWLPGESVAAANGAELQASPARDGSALSEA